MQLSTQLAVRGLSSRYGPAAVRKARMGSYGGNSSHVQMGLASFTFSMMPAIPSERGLQCRIASFELKVF
jgi:hypothetical protein